MNSKQRRAEAKRTLRDGILSALRQRGASCGNCCHIENRSNSSTGHSCGRENTGGTYMPVKTTDLRSCWSAA